MISSFLTPWSNFYIMTGTAAASLIGLMFVVITLLTGVERTRRSSDGISAFSTPTVVHFGAALLVSLLAVVPWHSLVPPSSIIALAGACGVVYVLRLLDISRRKVEYEPDVEDWTWYTILPILAYGALFVGALLVLAAPVNALFDVAASVVLLIFIGIHNAWDIVTYLVTRGLDPEPDARKDDDAG
ncbi:MAG TPA: hypothetical protein VJN22_07575 [Candidatus Eremiobacteraceae bacterium]|nr:hypothetical protein [Candidatus Eremiobacteraceae bacterium]